MSSDLERGLRFGCGVWLSMFLLTMLTRLVGVLVLGVLVYAGFQTAQWWLQAVAANRPPRVECVLPQERPAVVPTVLPPARQPLPGSRSLTEVDLP